MKHIVRVASWAAFALSSSCIAGHAVAQQQQPQQAPTATVLLEPTKGNAVRGVVTFVQQSPGVAAVTVRVSGLKPGQEHGFHLHDKGDCSSGDGMSAGGHFNPASKPHGPQDADHHAGDLPALKADANGIAAVNFTIKGVLVGTCEANDVIGHGLIVHAAPDDYATQPTGNSGARIACGVIAAQ